MSHFVCPKSGRFDLISNYWYHLCFSLIYEEFMETNLNRNEKILAYMTFAAIAGFAVLFMQVNLKSNTSVSQIGTGMQVNYQMARPEENYSEYSLSGREIDQSYEAVAKKIAAQKTAAQAKAAAIAKPKTEAQKKTEADKKKLEATQKAAALARSQAAQAAALKKNVASDKNLASDKKSDSKSTEKSSTENSNTVAQEQNRPEANPQDNNVANQKKKKSFAQWREQVFAQPTRETINSFLDAYKKGEVSAVEVQAMAQDLLDQNNENLKGLGLYTLRATPSLASLSQLVHIEEKLSATYKVYVEQAYLAYMQPQNVGFLGQALQTKDKTLIAKTLTILNTNLPNVGKIDSRQGRDNGSLASGLSMSSFVGLLPALSTLSTSQEFAALAQQAMAYIQSSNNVAQN